MEPNTNTNPNPAPNTQTDPNSNEPANNAQSSAPRNVNAEQFNSFVNQTNTTLNGIAEALNGLKQAPSNSAAQSAANNTTTSSQDDETKAATQTELERLRLANQTNLVKSEAQSAGFSVNGIEKLLIGKDDDSTKANFKAFNDYLTAHDEAVKKAAQPSTDNGFNAAKNDVGDSKSFLDALLDTHFGVVKK